MCERACGLEGCVAEKPKLLFVAGEGDELPASIASTCEIVEVHNPLRPLARVGREEFDGIYVAAKHFSEALPARPLARERPHPGRDARCHGIFDSECIILWANERLRHWTNRGNIVGEHFFAASGQSRDRRHRSLAAAGRTANWSSGQFTAADGRQSLLPSARRADRRSRGEDQNLVVTVPM